MQDYLEKNLNAFPKLKKLYNQHAASLYQTEKSKSNDITIKLNGIYMHSAYDPVKEANRIVEMLLIDKELLDVVILFGSGLGYAAELLYDKIIKNNSNKVLPYIIYIEKDVKLFMTSLKYFDWSEKLMDEHFKLFLDIEKEVIGSFIQTIPTKRIRYHYHRPSYSMFEEYYKSVQNYMTYVLDRKDMNTATFCNFQKLWTKNYIYNLKKNIQTKYIKDMTDIAKNSTAVVIAAGPTLNLLIPYIKSIKDKAVIIAIDTPYKYLKKNGIVPDIIATVDPQYWNYKYLENERLDDSLIVTNCNAYHKVLNLANVNNYFTGTSIFPISKYFEPDNNKRGTLAAGGSVATTAFDTARIIGASNIILLGLDLSFPNRMTHFKGAYFETNFLKQGNYFNTAEHMSYNYMAHVNLLLIESTNGHVYTDQKMNLFKKWFDREIPVTKANVYIPDLGQAKFEGAKIVKLENIPEPDENAKLKFLKNKKELLKKVKYADLDDVNYKIELVLSRSKDIKEICKKIVNLIPENGNVDPAKASIIDNLESMLFKDEDIYAISNVISSSAQDVLLSIMENFEYSDNEKYSAWIKTRILHKSILDLTEFYTKCLKKMLKIN